jgi:hypothetical protein
MLAPPHRRTAAPPHRRTAAPPHRRTAAPPHRRRLAKLTVPAAVLFFGCAEAPTAVPLEPDAATQFIPPALAMACSPGIFTGFRAVDGWSCNTTVEFYTSNNSLAQSMATAVGEWQANLAATGFGVLPTFATTNVPSSAEATVTGTATGTAFCGQWHNNIRLLEVFADAGCANFSNGGALSAVLRHEVGHAVGWTGSGVHKLYFGTAEADHCVMHLPEDGSLNTTICVHEIEGALAGYGLISYDAENFFNRAFVVGTQGGMAPFTLQVGQTASPSPGNWRLGSGATVPGTASSYIWTSSNSAVATVTFTGGVVTGVAPGTATIRARPSASSAYLFAHPFVNSGISTTVTVPNPPPPPYMVTVDETPIVTVGSHAFTAHIGNSGSTVYWRVDDSRTTTVDPDATFTTSGQLAQLGVDAGSYTLIFRVGLSPWPSGWNKGYLPLGWHEQQIPVCTGGGSENAAWSGKSSGGQTNAVENCPPPESE